MLDDIAAWTAVGIVLAGFMLTFIPPDWLAQWGGGLNAMLVFLLVGPATNIASFALLKRELGLKVTAMYLFGLSVFSLIMGLLLEWLLQSQQWQVTVKLGEAHTMLAELLSWVSAILLIFLAIKPVRRMFIPQLG